MKKVLITAPVHQDLISGFEALGFDVTYLPDVKYNELLTLMADAEGLVVTTRVKVDAQMIDAAPHLKWIGRLGSGMELIDTAYAGQKGIACYSTPEGNRNAVAEHTLALLLNILNNVAKSFDEIKQGKWLRNENRGTELSGKTVGIIGFGNTGSSFARLLAPFNVKVLAYDKYKTNLNHDYIQSASLEQIFREADIVSLHVPLTAETYHFANADFFNAFYKKIFFLTTCRGKVTDTAALISALEQNKLAGAALDVLENEKLDQLTAEQQQQLEFLVAHPHVVLTPHIAGYSSEAFVKMGEVLLQKLGLGPQ